MSVSDPLMIILSVVAFFFLGLALGLQWQYESGFKAGWKACEKYAAEEMKKIVGELRND